MINWRRRRPQGTASSTDPAHALTGGTSLEYEGRQHADVDQFGRDIDRYSLMAADGWVALRFAGRHLNPDVVIDRTRRTLISRGWRPPPRVGG